MISLSERQKEIIRVVKRNAPITGEQIAELLGVARPTLRSDLSLLVMLGHLDAKPKVGYYPGANAAEVTVNSILSRTVREVQSLPVLIRETASIQDAVVMLFMENVGSLIITDAEGDLAGVVSRKDLLKVTLGNSQAAAMPVGLIMTRHPNVITVSPDDTVAEAAKRMIRHQIDALPVTVTSERAGKWEVVGRLTKTTLTKLLVDAEQGTAGGKEDE
ncbi:CBS domain-containing protein [Paenibacillus aurantius]|uniref:CBS domain-containing protein n=1 Tax=Paenibacillus aurantius TaxID=2918900 RepID=A0AA96RDE9_9BACL|nr:CBS domain-containing protein [Paenibacillus aurantius]WNQ09013.1 CBS domain-containing protein [Paenibacillus aurantius]